MRELEKTWAGVWCAGLLLAACGDSHDKGKPPVEPDASVDLGAADGGGREPRYVGEVDDSDVRVAVIADDEHARVFFCGGDSSYASDTHWFALDLDGDTLDADDGDWHLHAERGSDGVHGDLEHADDAARSFTASPVAPGTLAGLYEGTGQCGRIGLIVAQTTPDADVHAQGACVGGGHDPEQVNPIFPIALMHGGVQVQAPGEDAQPVLEPATLTPL
jgi:hypothetical protein